MNALPATGDPIARARALLEAGEGAAALQLLRRQIARGRGGFLMRRALVHTLLACGDKAAALKAAREAVSLNPGVATALALLGEALAANEALPAAIAEFHRALRLDPDLAEARYGLGCAWLSAGEAQRALDVFAGIGPEAMPTPLLAEKIAAAKAMLHAARCDAGYVRHLFDQFSGDYDARMLGNLAYAGPQILRELADLVMPGRTGLSILDLGCGTGLAGQAFCDRAARLEGIDLSPAMIAKARLRDIYQRLEVCDLEQALAREGARYDLILAADTLVYLGDLGAVFAGAARRLARDGFFLFTVESQEEVGFALGPKRRWRHSADYIKAIAAAAGLMAAGIVACSPRREANQPVPGLAVALTLPR
jgi:predicted TPR repeat methyltransferase